MPVQLLQTLEARLRETHARQDARPSDTGSRAAAFSGRAAPVLVARRGIPCGRPRPPLVQISPEEFESLLPAIEATGVLDWAI